MTNGFRTKPKVIPPSDRITFKREMLRYLIFHSKIKIGTPCFVPFLFKLEYLTFFCFEFGMNKNLKIDIPTYLVVFLTINDECISGLFMVDCLGTVFILRISCMHLLPTSRPVLVWYPQKILSYQFRFQML